MGTVCIDIRLGARAAATSACCCCCCSSWRVRVWLSSAPASPTAWGCGPALFDTAPGKGTFPGTSKWVGGGGQLRSLHGLTLPRGSIARAEARVSGVGAFYLFINGRKVGQNIMDPPQTVYSKTVLYSTFDVPKLIPRSYLRPHFLLLYHTPKAVTYHEPTVMWLFMIGHSLGRIGGFSYK